MLEFLPRLQTLSSDDGNLCIRTFLIFAFFVLWNGEVADSNMFIVNASKFLLKPLKSASLVINYLKMFQWSLFL